MSAEVVTVFGEGRLAEMVCKELAPEYPIVRRRSFGSGAPGAAGLALVLQDGWNPNAAHMAEEWLAKAGIPWLGAFISFGEGMIGPLVRPGVPGCSRCADSRRLMADGSRRETWGLQQRLASQGGTDRDAWASPSGLLQMAYLLAAEVRSVLSGGNSRLDGRVQYVSLKTLRSSIHSFLPDPSCPVCGDLPDDSRTAASIKLSASPKLAPGTYRCRSMDELKKVLRKDYLDYRMGLLNGTMQDLVSPFADTAVNLPLPGRDEACGGRSHSYAHSEYTGILEGLERHCGLTPRGKRTVVHESYANLGDQALDPAKVGLHTKEQYEQPDFPFITFYPEKPINWVWGYSFLEERPILVPERLAYYSTGRGNDFVFETSNGCALGGTLEEAIFYGMMEVVERDSFLMTWYARLPLPRLDPYSSSDPELALMVDRIEAVAGYEVMLFNSTMEHGIPSVWALARNKKPAGVHLICAAGAHPDPVRAATGAVQEVASLLLTYSEKFEKNREQYVRMLHDSSLVRQMEDHSMLYALPEAEHRLKFLTEAGRPCHAFNQQYRSAEERLDLAEDLKEMLEAFRKLNMDVIVVDQTGPELRRNGLHCVKVLIPGMLPMTFGHHLTRLTGLDRVLHVPWELGYARQPLTPQQLNPYPHPFP
ncbi:TOMM precursor leader peptide-binding protein [Paenibacillus filicis]|uniref:TOMM leader peptide-binding protein n=1 Tax=Paenibacillus gyeongsangnamensis TaxID=3388067 RepID=A0ABT4Q4N2_9BACL|nr:TOMM precursor leader peptide-binding protein [Paenibacillus filicis]MCZ8511835.1 TOMM precursor leader peptide-binding protein [Paenibacillus filicis]